MMDLLVDCNHCNLQFYEFIIKLLSFVDQKTTTQKKLVELLQKCIGAIGSGRKLGVKLI